MLLAVDIGNTETALGLYGESGSVKTFRFPSDMGVTADLLYSLVLPHVAPDQFDRVAISSVVPHLTHAWSEFAAKVGSASIVIEPLKIPGIEIRIPRPEEAGVDRVVNSWMGFRRYGGPLVVVDMGTATTFDVVSEDGAYLGGIIAPGPLLFTESLSRRTAKLPRIDLAPPNFVIGRTTVEALRSGVLHGHASMVDGLLTKIEGEIGPRRVIATGGLSGSVRPFLDSRFHAFDPSLTLDGIAAIARL